MKINHKIKLSADEISIYSGSEGEFKAKLLKTMCFYADRINAENLIPITNYVSLSGDIFLRPSSSFFDLLNEFINSNVKIYTKCMIFDCINEYDIKLTFFERRFYKKYLINPININDILDKLNIEKTSKSVFDLDKDITSNDVLCVSNEVESTYINSVIGAKCNLASNNLNIFQAVFGKTFNFNMTDVEKRKGNIIININATKLINPELLGILIGKSNCGKIPYIKNISRFMEKLDALEIESYLKKLSNSISQFNINLFYIENITTKTNDNFINSANIITVDDNEIQSIEKLYTNKQNKIKYAFIGSPKLNSLELESLCDILENALKKKNKSKVKYKTIAFSTKNELEKFKKSNKYKKLLSLGVSITVANSNVYALNNAMFKKTAITNSYSFSLNSGALYLFDDEFFPSLT